jgi:predicted SprT family Zn-dependent metalloprotease
LHELCHWANLLLHKCVDDGSNDFENELKRVGASSSKTYERGGKYHVGKCKKCGKTVGEELNYETLKRRLNTNDYYTRCCHSQIVYGGTVEYNSKFVPTDKLIQLNIKFKEYYYKKCG